MKRIFKWLGIGLGSLVALLLVALAVVYGWSAYRLSGTMDVDPPMAAVDMEAADVQHGKHLSVIRGCTDCHGDNFGGKVMIDDLPMAGRLVAPNLTSGNGGVVANYTDTDWIRAIRHGLDPAGRKLVFMPSYEFAELAATDLADLTAYLKTIPAVDSTVPPIVLGPIFRFVYLSGQYPLIAADIIDHEAPFPDKPDPSAQVEMGKYLSTGCTGCHGPGLSGGKIPGTPPDFPAAANLTPDESGLADWDRQQFQTLMKSGTRPDGRKLDEQYMPWQNIGQMTDAELDAIWAYLQSLPPKPHGGR
ncbi:MAG: cytochrome c [Bradymonadaceae bacterium]